MNGPEHFREAERLVVHSKKHTDTGCLADESIARLAAAQGQVHATLALVAASTQPVIRDDEKMLCAHGAVICGLCGYGVPAGDGSRS